MKILITGATSFLGAETARAFLRAGDEVYAPVRPSSKRTGFLPQDPSLHRINIDMDEIGRLPETGIPSPEVCVHFAWSGVGVRGRMDPEIQERNVRNTLMLIRTLGEMGCRRFLFAGSQAEYGVTLERVMAAADTAEQQNPVAPGGAGQGAGGPVTEAEACRPISGYGKAKLRILEEGAVLAQRFGMEYVHMRIFSVYGEGDHETSLVSSCVGAAREGRRAELGPCRQLWNFLHVRDCAAAVLALAKCGSLAAGAAERGSETVDGPAEPGIGSAAAAAESGTADSSLAGLIYNIGSGDTRPLRDFVQEVFDIAAACGYDGAGFSLNDRPAGPEGTPYLSPDISKICRATGWKPEISFKEGIREMLLP